MIGLLCFFLTLFARSSRRADLRSECRAFDLHSLTLVLFPILRDTLNGMRAMPSLHRRRGAHFSADQWRRLQYRRPSNWGPMPFGCSRLIVTRWISLPPRVRLASFKHSASSHALLLVGFCCSFLFCFMGEVLRNLGV